MARAIGRSPSALAMKLTNIASLDPAITQSLRTGLRNASANDRAMWREMEADWRRFAVETRLALEEVARDWLPTTQSSSTQWRNRLQLPGWGGSGPSKTTARMGHDFFREAVRSAHTTNAAASPACLSPRSSSPVTSSPGATTAANRANPRNGLLLSALHDKAFDRGILTITDDMTVRVSPKYTESTGNYFTSAIVNYEGSPISLPEIVRP